ncbi:hypothetical protein [Idiomarina xiamenensis]|uniref:Uncharacterized protein n=1 Tax=Idiomarina xiamenensis 10-D-4 TaxID=740709 RepID=K2JTR6_9GAMM|nr:hypothetical protein [Idiomarina xiamenensis]EKE86836.1 hypothetical protein A10D4_01302 [Idiomarina xiamenensis 10-D-4]
MVIALLVIVVGLAATISGIYEAQQFVIGVGVVMMLVGYISFRWLWRKRGGGQKSGNDKQPPSNPHQP